MTRSNFLKQLAVFIIAPSVVKNIKVTDQPKLPIYKTKKAFYYKISTDMFEDKGYMEYFKNVILKEKADQYSIDLNKPFNYYIGFDGDDFCKNLMTIIVSQYE